MAEHDSGYISRNTWPPEDHGWQRFSDWTYSSLFARWSVSSPSEGKGPVFPLTSQSSSWHQKSPRLFVFLLQQLTRILVSEPKWVDQLGFDDPAVMEKVPPFMAVTQPELKAESGTLSFPGTPGSPSSCFSGCGVAFQVLSTPSPI